MVTTSREREVFLLEPGNQSHDTENREQEYGFILVVEDDAPTLRLERVILEEAGYTVEVVDSGEEAVRFIAEKSPTLVLLDIGLPGMDGFAACAQIRELSNVPIIMVTGRDCLDDKVRGMDVGADDYVTKPFLTHELATRVKVVLRRTSASVQEHKDNQYFGGLVPEYPERPGNLTEVAPAQPEAPATQPQIAPDEPEPPAVQAQVAPAQPDPTPTDSSAAEQVAAPPESTEEKVETPAPVEEVLSPEPPIDDAPVEVPKIPASESGIYEGTVQLTVTALGPVRNLINFVSELRQNPQFRLLRLVANQHKEGMDIWLGLREPLELVQILSSLPGVHEVMPGSDPLQEDEQLLILSLD